MNRLAQENSPYLLQHKDNPVDWYAWGQEAFLAAKIQNKPIFLSIGYSTCYWCHVMEKDSFEREEVAQVLNKNFIAIKLDREERPDIDQLYMSATINISGHGGWPMSVFLTPQLKPFYAGTFFYREQFIELLEQISKVWLEQKSKVEASADQILELIRTEDKLKIGLNLQAKDQLELAFKRAQKGFDCDYGGFGSAPKFPPSMTLGLLMRMQRQFPEKKLEIMTMLEKTLEAMARGGIYDQLAGGFSRYSTDHKWLVPHFEKMLYDNALIISSYLEAYQITKNDFYAQIIDQTLNYVILQMQSEVGGYYSAQDAGEVGKEGEYYVWSYQQLKDLLNADEFELFSRVYGVTEVGNFEGHNILNLQKDFDWKIKSNPLIISAEKKLLTSRMRRRAPHLDSKILVSWNSLMISCMALASRVLNKPEYLLSAEKALNFIKNKMWDGQKLSRRFCDGVVGVEACLEDYAFLIDALINMYQANFKAEYLDWAKQLQKTQDQLFWDEKQQAYIISCADDLVIKRVEFTDSAIPSGNSVSLANLMRLNSYFAKSDYRARFNQLLGSYAAYFEQYPLAVTRAMSALDFVLSGSKECVIVGNDQGKIKSFLNKINQEFLPNVIVALKDGDEINNSIPSIPLLTDKTLDQEKTQIYICHNHTCQQPVCDLEMALSLLI